MTAVTRNETNKQVLDELLTAAGVTNLPAILVVCSMFSRMADSTEDDPVLWSMGWDAYDEILEGCGCGHRRVRAWIAASTSGGDVRLTRKGADLFRLIKEALKASEPAPPVMMNDQDDVTGNGDDRKPGTIRQEKYRAELKAKGLVEVITVLGPEQVARLDYAQVVRGGLSGPYSRAEYVATLIERDAELLEQQEGRLSGRVCENCRKVLPRGCGGLWAAEAPCLRAKADRALLL